jgi:hypothetical protein
MISMVYDAFTIWFERVRASNVFLHLNWISNDSNDSNPFAARSQEVNELAQAQRLQRFVWEERQETLGADHLET